MPNVLTKRRVLSATAFTALFASSMAQAAWYKVEVILFKHNDQASINSEYHSTEVVKMNASNAVPLKDKGAFRELSRGQRSLAKVASRMRNSRHYTVLAHTGWVQPGYRTKNKKPAMLAYDVRGAQTVSVGEIPVSDRESNSAVISDIDNYDIIANSQPRVNALISLYKGRYLHLDTEMVYYADTSGSAAYTDPNAAYDPNAETQAPAPAASLTAYHLKEERRVRDLGKLHYYDHPAIGIVAKISVVK